MVIGQRKVIAKDRKHWRDIVNAGKTHEEEEEEKKINCVLTFIFRLIPYFDGLIFIFPEFPQAIISSVVWTIRVLMFFLFLPTFY